MLSILVVAKFPRSRGGEGRRIIPRKVAEEGGGTRWF